MPIGVRWYFIAKKQLEVPVNEVGQFFAKVSTTKSCTLNEALRRVPNSLNFKLLRSAIVAFSTVLRIVYKVSIGPCSKVWTSLIIAKIGTSHRVTSYNNPVASIPSSLVSSL